MTLALSSRFSWRAPAAFAAGLLFGVGLLVSGMTQPAKVVAFLDVAHGWDPSLAFVMGGAVLVHALLFRLVLRRASPLFEARFHVPTRRDLDARLIGGAILFGVGWGLAGICPGPGIVAAASLAPPALVFVAAMLGGMFLFERFDRVRSVQGTRRAARAARAAGPPRRSP